MSSSTGLMESSTGLVCSSVNAGNNQLPGDCIWSYFVYTPSKAADIFFLVTFAVLTALVAYQAIRSKQHWLHSLTLFGALECSGYIARAVVFYNTNNTAFTAELVIIILAPNCLAFCCYVVLGKIITYVFKTKSDGKVDNWLTRHPAWVPGFYLCSDIFCIVIQGIGGAILANADTSSSLNTGKGVEIVGLALQLFFIGTFLIICAYVWRKMHEMSNGAELVKSLTPSYAALMAIITLLVVRNIYRVAEFSVGGFTTGYFQQNEAWYLVFDPTLMVLALTIAILFDFTRRLPAECLDGSMMSGAWMERFGRKGKKGGASIVKAKGESEMVHVTDVSAAENSV